MRPQCMGGRLLSLCPWIKNAVSVLAQVGILKQKSDHVENVKQWVASPLAGDHLQKHDLAQHVLEEGPSQGKSVEYVGDAEEVGRRGVCAFVFQEALTLDQK